MQVEQKFVQRATQAIVKGPIALTDLCGLESQLKTRQPFANLPEVLFVGSTNVGKSSLLSRLLTPRGSPKPTHNKPRDTPNISNKKGFTRTLNFYTIGNSLRLVDSPGYGFRSCDIQGAIMHEYLENYSQVLRQVFILAHSVKGLTEHDVSVANILSRLGIPFDIVLTKSDMVKDPSNALASIESQVSGLNAIVNHIYPTSASKDVGIDQLRGAIWKSLQ